MYCKSLEFTLQYIMSDYNMWVFSMVRRRCI